MCCKCCCCKFQLYEAADGLAAALAAAYVTAPKSQVMKLDQNFMLFYTALLDSALCDSIALKIPMWPEPGVGLVDLQKPRYCTQV